MSGLVQRFATLVSAEAEVAEMKTALVAAKLGQGRLGGVPKGLSNTLGVQG